MSDLYSGYFENNRQSWNARTGVHKDSAFYDLQGFKAGKNCLSSLEMGEVGDVLGKSLLHLQCHFGMDTLNWQRLGARTTGVDLSDAAIDLARQINEEMGLDARFIRCNLYDLPEQLDEQFDIVFTSYGTIGWLPDLNKWAALIARYLKPGGMFYIADFHPTLWMMDNDFKFIQYHYFNTEVIEEEIQGSYTDRDAPIRIRDYSWNHPFTEILNSLIGNGLRIVQFNEFPYSVHNCFNHLEQGTDGNWRIIGMDEKLPMMYSIKAIRG